MPSSFSIGCLGRWIGHRPDFSRLRDIRLDTARLVQAAQGLLFEATLLLTWPSVATLCRAPRNKLSRGDAERGSARQCSAVLRKERIHIYAVTLGHASSSRAGRGGAGNGSSPLDIATRGTHLYFDQRRAMRGKIMRGETGLGPRGTRFSLARLGPTTQCRARQGTTTQGTTLGVTMQRAARLRMAGSDMARRGTSVRRRMIQRRLAGHGNMRCGTAWLVPARFGKARDSISRGRSRLGGTTLALARRRRARQAEAKRGVAQ